MYRFTTLIMIVSLAFIQQAAFADPAPITVQFADLDLTKTQGAATLYQRLHHAADTVCAPLESRDLSRMASFKKCVQSAIESAVVQVDRPSLTAYYQTKFNVPNAPIQVAGR